MRIGSPLAHKKARIEIIPLIDVMFFLLASFMMVSLTMQKAQTIRMNLPSAVAKKESYKVDIFNIAINAAGELYVGKDPKSMTEMVNLLTNRFHANTNLAVYITGDKDASHGRVVQVLDWVRRNGIEKVSFAIEPAK